MGPNHPPIKWGVGSSSGVKRSGREVDHSPPSSTDVKNEWGYTSTPPVFLHRVDRDNCILSDYTNKKKII
jgi:hypothetical protein